MKKILTVVFAATLALVLTACGGAKYYLRGVPSSTDERVTFKVDQTVTSKNELELLLNFNKEDGIIVVDSSYEWYQKDDITIRLEQKSYDSFSKNLANGKIGEYTLNVEAYTITSKGKEKKFTINGSQIYVRIVQE